MNKRKPILVVVALGGIVVLLLSLLPMVFGRFGAFGPQAKSTQQEDKPAESPNSTPARPSQIIFDVAAWYNSRNEQPDTHGVLIESEDGSTIYASHNPNVTFNPASLIKLSTTLASLKNLGAEYRFQTHVLMDGYVDKSGTLQGSLNVQGSDPTFGDAGANMIAIELKKHGIKKVSKTVSVTPDFCFNFTDVPEEAADRLIKVLKIGNPKPVVSETSTGENLLTVNSNPLKDILLYMNAHSSNFIAERLGAMIGGPEGLQKFLVDQVGLPSDQVTIARTSGREHNRMTPRGLLAVIRGLMDEAKKQGLQPSDVMAVASDDSGTLRRRLAGTGLEGSVVAKTGTLTHEVDGGMASLAGIVYTKNAGPVLFAILDQGNRIAENRQLEDQLLSEVVRKSAVPEAVGTPVKRQMLPAGNLSAE